MNNFTRSKFFSLIIIIVVILLVIMAASASMAGRPVFLSNIGGILFSPVQKITTGFSNMTSDYVARFTEFNRLKEENAKLKTELSKMASALGDIEHYKEENETLKKLLGLKEERTDFEFAMAQIVSRDPGNWFETFMIDRGTLAGIAAKNPVITSEGLVGYVSEVGTTWAKITPITESDSVVGAIVTRTRDVALVEGDLALSKNGECKLSYLSKDTTILKGDRVETSGLGGIFPKGLLVGTVRDVRMEAHGITKYAVVTPTVDFDQIRDVFVITSFQIEGGE